MAENKEGESPASPEMWLGRVEGMETRQKKAGHKAGGKGLCLASQGAQRNSLGELGLFLRTPISCPQQMKTKDKVTHSSAEQLCGNCWSALLLVEIVACDISPQLNRIPFYILFK